MYDVVLNRLIYLIIIIIGVIPSTHKTFNISYWETLQV